MKNIFITGVDTDIGKTFVSIGLLLSSQNKGLKVGYFKPFQSGAKIENGKVIAPDLFELKKYSNIPSKYSYLLNGEVSPHLASIIDNVKVDFEKVKKDYVDFSSSFDLTIIEGAGGLYCPAIQGKLFIDVIKELNKAHELETIIVTTPALGRLNHTLMTLKLAKAEGINIKGIIINNMPENPTLSEANFIKELKMFDDTEILSVIKHIQNPNNSDIINAFSNIYL